MENLLKLNFLKITESKKTEDTVIPNVSNNNEEIVKDVNNKFFISNEMINNGEDFENKGLLKETDVILKSNNMNKNIDKDQNEILAAEHNIKINQNDLETNLLDINKHNKNININSNFNKMTEKKHIIEPSNKKKEGIEIDKKAYLNNANIESLSNIDEVFKSNKQLKNNNHSSIFSRIRASNKARIKSFFQNYINYSTKSYNKKNIKSEKTSLSNTNLDLNTLIISGNNADKSKHNLVQVQNIETKKNKSKTIDAVNKDQNLLNDTTIRDKSDRTVTSFKEVGLENFDRLKNILDIKSHNIQQRFTQILENNIKLNNNRFEIQLRPENLGKVHITLEITGQNVDININSDNMNSLQVLNENNSNLQKMLQNHGMNLNNFNLNGNNSKNKDKDGKNFANNNKENISIDEENNSIVDNDRISDKLLNVKA